MKNFLLFVMMFALPLSAMAIEDDLSANPDSVVAFSASGRRGYKHQYNYDLAGRVTSKAVYDWTGLSGWQETANYEYTYNAAGQLLTESYKLYIDGEWVPQYLWETTYENGRKASIVYTAWSSGLWQAWGRMLFAYDEAGLMISEEMQTCENGIWTPESLNEYTYDEAGFLICFAEYTWSGDHWSDFRRHEYTYDESGHRITDKEVQENFRVQTEYTYDSKGRVVEELTPDQRITYTYDDEQLTMRKVIYNKGSEAWEVQDVYEYAYDAAGHEISWKYNDYQKAEKTYDDLGRLVKDVTYENTYAGMTVIKDLRYYYSDAAGLNNQQTEKGQKVLLNGKVLIRHDGRMYDLLGREVK